MICIPVKLHLCYHKDSYNRYMFKRYGMLNLLVFTSPNPEMDTHTTMLDFCKMRPFWKNGVSLVFPKVWQICSLKMQLH